MSRYIDLDQIEFLQVDGNKEFNHGVDCCINRLLKAEPVDVIPREKIKLLGEEHRKFREGITDEKVLIGFNMAIAICNKYLAESEDKE